MLGKLLGRIVAHELGHVLLNSPSHADSGLMRALYQAGDVCECRRRPTPSTRLSARGCSRSWPPAPALRLNSPATIVAQFRDDLLFRAVPPAPARPSPRAQGSPVALTPKAFDLLLALVVHRERALSKDEILSLVWPGSIVEESNLAQQVLLLRRALGSDDHIATIPRFGYRFTGTVIEERAGGASLTTSPHSLLWDGREYPLHEGITVIGRADDADVRIPLPSLSRSHARILVRGLEATLEDLGSRHGSFRGTLPVKVPTRLASGDEIRLGTATLVYCLIMPNDTTRA